MSILSNLADRVYSVGMRHELRTANWFATAFYIAVACFALVGNVIASATWLGWPWQIRAPLVGVFELGGVAILAFADDRRKKGETALVAQIMSAGVAVGAVVLNWLGHPSHITGGVFATLSGLGYGFWLLMSNARRRDQLRLTGKLPPKAPKYGGTWALQPRLTWQARQMALKDPTLGRYESIAAAQEAARQAVERAGLKDALRALYAEGIDPKMRAVALATKDFDAISARMRALADNDGDADALIARTRTAHFGAQSTTIARAIARAPDVNAHARKPRATTTDRNARAAHVVRTADEWWTRTRKSAYAHYADDVCAGKGECAGEDLRKLLDAPTIPTARSWRDRYFRARFAREVADGVRTPTCALPNALAGMCAATTARQLPQELRTITDPREERA